MPDSVELNCWTRIDSKVVKALKFNALKDEVILIDTALVGMTADDIKTATRNGYDNDKVFFNAQEFFDESELEQMTTATIAESVVKFTK